MAIRRLSDECIRRMAAGEVVQRPVNVVKELLENSLDSRAQSIVVKITNGGLSHISVIDDGEGISVEDLEVICQPHHTSKIGDHSQLASLSTYGFRGEALYSIASVSRLVVSSRQKGAPEGFTKDVKAWKISNSSTVSDHGSQIDVFDLFYNLELRRRVIERNGVSKETAVIRDLVVKYGAHLCPSVSLSMYVNNALVFHNSASKPNILAGIFSCQSELIQIQLTDPIEQVQEINMYIARESSQPESNVCISFVNGRLCEIIHLEKTLRQHLRSTASSSAKVFIEYLVAPSAMDFNVSPTKRTCSVLFHERLLDVITGPVNTELDQHDRLSIKPNKDACLYGAGDSKCVVAANSPCPFKVRTDSLATTLDHYSSVRNSPKIINGAKSSPRTVNDAKSSCNITFVGMINGDDCLMQQDGQLCMLAIRKTAKEMVEAGELLPTTDIYVDPGLESGSPGLPWADVAGIVAANEDYFRSRCVFLREPKHEDDGGPHVPSKASGIDLSEVVLGMFCLKIQNNPACRFDSDFFEFFAFPAIKSSLGKCWRKHTKKIADIPFLFKSFERC